MELRESHRRRRPTLPGLLLALALGITGCRPASPPPPGLAGASATPGAAGWFEDITEASGIRFTHTAGTDYFMPEQVGSGSALFDYDNDGRLDLLLLQYTGPAAAKAGGPSTGHRLYHQEPDGTFRDVSEGSGLNFRTRGMGVAAADLNNDGLIDLVITEHLGSRVYQNMGGGKFQELGRESGVDNPVWATVVSFLDYDRDGRLDLVIGNYVDYDPTQACLDSRGERDFCGPQAYPSTPARLWRNVTSTAGAPIRFEDQTDKGGLRRAGGAALGVICADFDGDGWPDIFCADDGRPNRLFMNRHDGTFVEEAVQRGLAFNSMGQSAANMGVAWGDFDGDGMEDLFVTHLSDEFHGLWRQGPRGLFMDQLAASGLQSQAWRGTGFGTVAADFDLDGDLDLALVNGLVRHSLPGQTPVIPGTDPFWQRYAQRPQLFENQGGGRFADVSPANPEFCGRAMVGRSLSVGDLNNDGVPDLVASGIGGPVRIYRGRPHPGHHWLKLRLIEPRLGGRDAIGAEARVLGAEGRGWSRLLQPATSYLSSHDPALHFGLGRVAQVEAIDVRWADGTEERFPGGPADQTRTLRHGEGTRPPARASR